MTIEIESLETQHSDLDDVFRRHAFERLREVRKPVRTSEAVASSPNGAASAQQRLDMLVERGMAILQEEKPRRDRRLSVQPTPHRMSLGGDDLFTWCLVTG